MTRTIGVLTARVRVEEKQLLAALTTVGCQALPLPPASEPLPLAPVPSGPSALTADGLLPRLLIDRCHDREVAAASLPVWQALGVTVIDAGLAARGNRAAVATVLAAAGLPRPACYLAGSESAALQALAKLGYPATLLPLAASESPILLLDQDSAEAIVEHRSVLGRAPDAIGVLQAGPAAGAQQATVVVVDGSAVAISECGTDKATCSMIALAERAATVLGADIAGVELIATANGPVVWDVNPVPDFRDLQPLGPASVAQAIASMTARRLTAASEWRRDVAVQMTLSQPAERAVQAQREVADGVALSA